MKQHVKKQLKWIIFTALIMIIGIALFKYLPMYIYGNEILFDASLHIIFSCFILYILWFFVDQNKKLRVPYFIFSFAIIVIIALERILREKHNEVGLIIGLIISVIAIALPRIKEIKRNFKF